MTDELTRLAARCKGEVRVTFNPQTVSYQSVREFLEECAAHATDPIPAGDVAEMVAANTIVDVQFYPITPIGSHSVTKATLAAAVAEAHAILDREEAR